MNPSSANLSPQQPDTIWQRIVQEAQSAARDEPILAGFFQSTILDHDSLGSALSYHLANKLASSAAPASMLRKVMDRAFSTDEIIQAVAVPLKVQTITLIFNTVSMSGPCHGATRIKCT